MDDILAVSSHRVQFNVSQINHANAYKIMNVGALFLYKKDLKNFCMWMWGMI